MLTELENYSSRIDDLRRQVRDLIGDLPPDALNWRPTDEPGDHASNSLAVLAAHVAGAEHFWIGEVVGGLPPTRDRDGEFETQARKATELVDLLDQVGAETRKVFASLTLSDLEGVRRVRDRSVPVRWGIVHIIDHTALHLGHMQLTVQLWKGGQSRPSPRWHERLGT